MTKSLQLSHLVLIVFIGLVTLILAVTFVVKPREYKVSVIQDDQPDFEFSDVYITHIDHGKKIFSLEAKSAKIYKDDKQLQLNTMSGTIFNQDTGALIFEAPSGNISLTNHLIELEKTESLLIQTEYITHLKMDYLQLNVNDIIGKGRGNIQILNQHFNIKSDELTFDVVNNQIYLDNNVDAVVNMAL